jgi:hypothetical protein
MGSVTGAGSRRLEMDPTALEVRPAGVVEQCIQAGEGRSGTDEHGEQQ